MANKRPPIDWGTLSICCLSLTVLIQLKALPFVPGPTREPGSLRYNQDEERKNVMKTSYPLPLELTRPVPMATDLDTALTANLGDTHYDPRTQVSVGHHKEGEGGHNTNSTCVNYGYIQVDDILNDFRL
jgi:hypothetical protein